LTYSRLISLISILNLHPIYAKAFHLIVWPKFRMRF